MSTMLQISTLAKQTNVPASTIRYYEEIGLIPAAKRGENGYRLYSEKDAERLRFVQRAKALEFTLTEIEEILHLREQGEAPCAFVIGQIEAKLTEVEHKITQLNQLKAELTELQQEINQLPSEKVAAKECVCHIIENSHLTHLGQITAQGIP